MFKKKNCFIVLERHNPPKPCELSILRFESFLFRFSTSGEFNPPEGVIIPGWFRRYLEARANEVGPANLPPPAVAIPPPPPPPVA